MWTRGTREPLQPTFHNSDPKLLRLALYSCLTASPHPTSTTSQRLDRRESSDWPTLVWIRRKRVDHFSFWARQNFSPSRNATTYPLVTRTTAASALPGEGSEAVLGPPPLDRQGAGLPSDRKLV